MSQALTLTGFGLLLGLAQLFLFVAGNILLFQSRRCGFISGAKRHTHPGFLSSQSWSQDARCSPWFIPDEPACRGARSSLVAVHHRKNNLVFSIKWRRSENPAPYQMAWVERTIQFVLVTLSIGFSRGDSHSRSRSLALISLHDAALSVLISCDPNTYTDATDSCDNAWDWPIYQVRLTRLCKAAEDYVADSLFSAESWVRKGLSSQ